MMEMLLEEQLMRELMRAAHPMHGPERESAGRGGPGRGFPHGPMGPGPGMEHPGCPGRPGRPGFPGGAAPGPGMSRPGRPGMDVPAVRPALSRERVLEVLLGETEGLRQRDVAERLHIGPPAMSEFVGHLENNGYLVREVDPQDRRATRLKLTEKGEARAWEVREERRERFARRFAALTDSEKQELLRLLQKLNMAGGEMAQV